MQQTRTELSSLPLFPVEFIDVPAIECDIEVRPNNTANDYWEKPFHGHRRNLSMPNSIRRFLASEARRLCSDPILTFGRGTPGIVDARGIQAYSALWAL
jgi:hypothetical protein